MDGARAIDVTAYHAPFLNDPAVAIVRRGRQAKEEIHMGTRRVGGILKRIGFLIAVSGAVLFQTTCTLNDFLATYGLSTLLSTLTTST